MDGLFWNLGVLESKAWESARDHKKTLKSPRQESSGELRRAQESPGQPKRAKESVGERLGSPRERQRAAKSVQERHGQFTVGAGGLGIRIFDGSIGNIRNVRKS